MDQLIQRFGLISGHLRRLLELAGWGKVPKASCSGAAHLLVERKHFFSQLTYHRDDMVCYRRTNSLRQEMRQHLLSSPLVLIPCPTTLQGDCSCCGHNCLLPLVVIRAFPETQSHTSSAGRVPGEVPGVRS